jgi:hypothetical protein
MCLAILVLNKLGPWYNAILAGKPGSKIRAQSHLIDIMAALQ